MKGLIDMFHEVQIQIYFGDNFQVAAWFLCVTGKGNTFNVRPDTNIIQLMYVMYSQLYVYSMWIKVVTYLRISKSLRINILKIQVHPKISLQTGGQLKDVAPLQFQWSIQVIQAWGHKILVIKQYLINQTVDFF